MDVIQKALIDITVAVILAAGGLAVSYLRAAKKKVEAQTETIQNQAMAQKVRDLLSHVEAIAEHVIKDVQQTAVDDLKAKGEFTPEVAAQIKVDAIAKVKEILGEELTGLAGEVFGDLNLLIGTLIESHVKDNKPQPQPQLAPS
ncbi:MAG: hypothetical protein ACYC41_13465 [Bacillota bacterium]